jgi:hypothetical protein
MRVSHSRRPLVVVLAFALMTSIDCGWTFASVKE